MLALALVFGGDIRMGNLIVRRRDLFVRREFSKGFGGES